jgi:hypothetical protein
MIDGGKTDTDRNNGEKNQHDEHWDTIMVIDITCTNNSEKNKSIVIGLKLTVKLIE